MGGGAGSDDGIKVNGSYVTECKEKNRTANQVSSGGNTG
jgi:hypothetical protein